MPTGLTPRETKMFLNVHRLGEYSYAEFHKGLLNLIVEYASPQCLPHIIFMTKLQNKPNEVLRPHIFSKSAVFLGIYKVVHLTLKRVFQKISYEV
mgnify:CR=1 FL=1